MFSDNNSSSTLVDETPTSPQMVSDSTRAYLEQLNSYQEGNSRPPASEQFVSHRPWWNAPIVVLFIATIFMVALAFFGFGASSINASHGMVPGPLIEVTAGDHLRVTFINHFPAATAVHFHGLMVPSSEDGVPGVGMKPIQPGQTYVYDFYVHDQDIGTHWYHSHYNDMVQVPGGFYGAFIVDPRPGTPQYRQMIKADVTYTEFISEMGPYYVINGKSFPDTQPILVKHGQTAHIRLIGSGEMIHPMHMHGHTFNIMAEDGHMLAQSVQKDTVQVAPGETYDLTFYAWAAPGSIYPFHCHILGHLMNPGQTADEMGGLITLIEYAK